MKRLLLALVGLLLLASPALAFESVGKFYATPPAATVEGQDRFLLTDSSGRLIPAASSVTLPGDALSTTNSTTSTLGGGAVFTGTAVDIGGASSVSVAVLTDQASATDGLSMQQSSDGTNWDVRDTYTVPLMAAGAGKTYSVQVSARYFRIVYTNGATPQTTFRLQTIVHVAMQATSSQRPSDSYSNENDLQQNWVFNSLWDNANSAWQRVRGDVNGAFTQGNVATGVTDAGNPVKVGGVASTSSTGLGPYTTGQRSDLWLTKTGAAVVGALEVTALDGRNGNAAIPVGQNSTTNLGWYVLPQNYVGSSGYDRQFACNNTAVINVAPGTTQLVALSGSTVIRVCSFDVAASLAGSFKFVYGTGANCGTGTTDITGAMPIATNDSNSMSSGNSALFRSLAANALCLTAVTGTMTGFVTYAQF